MGNLLMVAVYATNIRDTESNILTTRDALKKFPYIQRFGQYLYKGGKNVLSTVVTYRNPVYNIMLQILEKDYQRKHKMGGRPPKLSVLDKLMIMLQYYREYRVMDNIAFDYGVSKSTISDAIKWVEETLVKDGIFRLPLKRKLLEDSSLEVILVDAPHNIFAPATALFQAAGRFDTYSSLGKSLLILYYSWIKG